MQILLLSSQGSVPAGFEGEGRAPLCGALQGSVLSPLLWGVHLKLLVSSLQLEL